MHIAVIGTGYVGLTTVACFAELGHTVVGIDNDAAKLEKIRQGHVPFFEPGLQELVQTHLAEQRISFTTSIPEGVKQAEVIFICVGTPPKEDGSPDLSAVSFVATEIAKALDHYAVIVEKSTVPVMTGEFLQIVLKSDIKVEFDVASNPEFLREGSAVHDFMQPDRIVIGTESKRADALLTELYKPLNAPMIHTDVNSAEMIKHASNAFLAMKISYANLLARLCDVAHADVTTVTRGVGYDKRIGVDFLNAGIGYGGFCFPKDLDAFMQVFKQHNVDVSLLEAVRKINHEQTAYFLQKVEHAVGNVQGKTLAVLGLAFKPNTDDMRFARSIDIVEALVQRGAQVRVYDPKAMENARKVFGEKVMYAENAYHAAEAVHAVLIVTEWNEFKNLDLLKLKKYTQVVVDGRNLFEPARMESLGFKYYGMGRQKRNGKK